MESRKKTGETDLKNLKESLEKAGLFVETLTENGANIKPISGQLSVKRTDGDTILMFEKRELSLGQYRLKPFVERNENEYETKNLFVIILK